MDTTPKPHRPQADRPAPPTSCSKCSGWLRPYHRSGLIVEQCEDCRGIFLDGGELERLIDAEGGGWSGKIGAPWPWISETSDGEPVSDGRAPRRR